MTLYVHQLKENVLVTHDGYCQLGLYYMSLKQFMSMAKVKYIESYWLPDTFSNRYKRINYQRHLNAASIGTKES